jgi:hypothetical protein
MVVYCDGTNVVDAGNYFTTLKTPAATITGGTITGITDLAVADGGTGASVSALASSNIAVGPSPEFLNLGLSMSVASNALTIAIKG